MSSPNSQSLGGLRALLSHELVRAEHDRQVFVDRLKLVGIVDKGPEAAAALGIDRPW